MKQLDGSRNGKSLETAYFENYEVKKSDIETLQHGIDLLAQSKLLENEILDDIRFVTYDSKHFYIITKGQHATNEKFVVEEVPSSSETGYKVYKVGHGGTFGKSRVDYRGARAWLLREEIESTAVNARKFPNENVVYQPELPQPSEILDVISMAPHEPYDKIQRGKYNYLTDVIFHEAGHIEHRRLKNWHTGDQSIDIFPSEEQREQFLDVIRQTNIFSQGVMNLIIEHIDKRAIGEMYPMVIDREAAKLYDPAQFQHENAEFETMMSHLLTNPQDAQIVGAFRESLRGGHITGRLLVRILEEKFPEFDARKQFVRSVLAPNSERKL